MKRIALWMSFLIFGVAAHAQTAAITQFCWRGGVPAVTSGLNSTNYLQGTIPSCTVTVYLTGTLTKATIYADGSNTPLANPFTANALGSAAPGQWLFYASTSNQYDVVLSGGIPPNTYQTPVTLTGLGSGGGGGGSFPSGVGLAQNNGTPGTPSINSATNPTPNVWSNATNSVSTEASCLQTDGGFGGCNFASYNFQQWLAGGGGYAGGSTLFNTGGTAGWQYGVSPMAEGKVSIERYVSGTQSDAGIKNIDYLTTDIHGVGDNIIHNGYNGFNAGTAWSGDQGSQHTYISHLELATPRATLATNTGNVLTFSAFSCPDAAGAPYLINPVHTCIPTSGSRFYESAQGVVAGRFTGPSVPFSAGAYSVTAYSIASNQLTLTVNNSLWTGGGQRITLFGFGTSTFLNGVTLTTTSATSTTIVAPFPYADTSATEAGYVTPLIWLQQLPTSATLPTASAWGYWIPAPFTATATINSPVLTGVSSTAGLTPTLALRSIGSSAIPYAGPSPTFNAPTISSIGSGTITMSQNATASGTVTVQPLIATNTTPDVPVPITFTLQGGSGTFSANQIVCVIGQSLGAAGGYVEQTQLTAVSGSTLTLPLGKPEDELTIFAGSCGLLGFDADYFINNEYQGYIYVGSLDGSSAIATTEGYSDTGGVTLPFANSEPELAQPNSTFAGTTGYTLHQLVHDQTTNCAVNGVNEECIEEVITPGTSGASAPTWTVGCTFDGTVVSGATGCPTTAGSATFLNIGPASLFHIYPHGARITKNNFVDTGTPSAPNPVYTSTTIEPNDMTLAAGDVLLNPNYDFNSKQVFDINQQCLTIGQCNTIHINMNRYLGEGNQRSGVIAIDGGEPISHFFFANGTSTGVGLQDMIGFEDARNYPPFSNWIYQYWMPYTAMLNAPVALPGQTSGIVARTPWGSLTIDEVNGWEGNGSVFCTAANIGTSSCPGGGVGGSGTVGTIPLWVTNTTTLGNSPLSVASGLVTSSDPITIANGGNTGGEALAATGGIGINASSPNVAPLAIADVSTAGGGGVGAPKLEFVALQGAAPANTEQCIKIGTDAANIDNSVFCNYFAGTSSLSNHIDIGMNTSPNLLDLYPNTNAVFANGVTAPSFTDSGLLNLSGTTAPLQFNGSAGTAGQCATSAGAGATPTWGSCGSGTFTALTGDATSTSTGGATEVVGLLNNALPSLATGYLNWTGSAWALSAGGGMIYPGAGIPYSNGFGWSTSFPLAGGGDAVVSGPNASTDSDVVSYLGTTGGIQDSNILASALVTLTGTQTLTNKTLASPVITGGTTVQGDGTHAGIIGIYGNTVNPTIPSNEWGFIGPNTATFTSWFFQPTTTAPTAGQVMVFGAPSGGVSQQTWATPAAAQVAANLASSGSTGVTGILPVPNGGTGLATLTAHSLQIGEGTSPPNQMAVCGTGVPVVGVTGADPICSASGALGSNAFNSTTIPAAQVAANLASSGSTGVTGQLPIGQVGSAGLSGSGGVSVASTGVVSCSQATGAALGCAEAGTGLGASSGVFSMNAQYRTWSFVDGVTSNAALPSSGYAAQLSYGNTTGVTLTITAIHYYSSSADSSTMAMTDTSSNTLLSGSSCTSAATGLGTSCTLSSTTTLASGVGVLVTPTPGGTSKNLTWIVSGTY